MSRPAAATTIPVIDLDRDPTAVARELDDVARTVGFFQIVNHGVPDDVADPAWAAARAFFDLPLADRMSVAKRDPSDPYGYVPMTAETLARSLGDDSAPDLKETFNVGPVDALTRPFRDELEAEVHTGNLWPAMLPELHDTWAAYYRSMLDLSARLLGSFAIALGLPRHWFDQFIDESPSALRAINYPAQDTPPAPGQLRAGAHTDYGTLTILRQHDAPGGLEVRSTADEWVPVPAVPGALVVNIGDLLARWSNDRWRSTLHRVVNPEIGLARSTRRQSMAFFHNANYHAVIECLPACRDEGAAPRYPTVVAGPHLMGKFRRTVTPS